MTAFTQIIVELSASQSSRPVVVGATPLRMLGLAFDGLGDLSVDQLHSGTTAADRAIDVGTTWMLTDHWLIETATTADHRLSGAVLIDGFNFGI